MALADCIHLQSCAGQLVCLVCQGCIAALSTKNNCKVYGHGMMQLENAGNDSSVVCTGCAMVCA